ncbi:MarR family winged helix-turn-helix transcriptional regulator [Lysinibacillus sp. LZ02]|uniref:MarR family winged helix-turn-helix transcriptional regulator n=1 Tax=Lysinibacillus sp. LZ02 TaxID=3420668 RepID=UPI003D3667D7
MSETIELLHKHYKQLRDAVASTWNRQNTIQITTSEWYILNCIFEGASTIPDILKKVEISKQAVHKFVTALEEKQLVQTELVKAPKTQKRVELTPLGEEIYYNSLEIKKEIDKTIEQNIGSENFKQLQAILQMKWM